jgi:hypothetical protein
MWGTGYGDKSLGFGDRGKPGPERMHLSLGFRVFRNLGFVCYLTQDVSARVPEDVLALLIIELDQPERTSGFRFQASGFRGLGFRV